MEKTDSSGAILEALILRGWCFRDVDEEVDVLIRSKSPTRLDTIESELINMDLRSVGGKSLPDFSTLRKSSHLTGPKILQVVSVRDVYKSSIEAPFGDSEHRRRLLRLGLTDGHSEIVAIEYSPIPSITSDISPGTKVRLENKIAIHNCILCLNSKVVTILGGLVQSLYEEWQISRKYSGFSRSSLRLSQNNEGVGPPQFEKLQIEACQNRVSQQHNLHGCRTHLFEQTAKAVVPTLVKSSDQQMGRNQNLLNQSISGKMENDSKKASLARTNEENPSSSESRPKETAEAVPVQNQAAAQKLLQKMTHSTRDDRQSRGSKFRGKGKQEETAVFTLDEWERRKGSMKPPMGDGLQNVSRDEELARQLQNQLDMEDLHVNVGHETEAEKIRKSMFDFRGAEESRSGSRTEFRGRRFG